MARSPVDEMLEQLRSKLHAQRGRLSEQLARTERAVQAYGLAAEDRLAEQFAAQHGIARPKGNAPPVGAAAQELVASVEALLQVGGGVAGSAQAKATPTRPVASPRSSVRAAPAATAPNPFPKLSLACESGKVAVIGALAGRQKEGCFPPFVAERTDFVDTARDGVHAIGNLPQRVRQGRVAAVIILDKAVQHQHSEPVVSAARTCGVPVAFAGKGGQASLLAALEQLERAL